MKIKLIICILLTLLSFRSWSNALQAPGIDFYHYWAVAKAKQFNHNLNANPYIDSAAYASVINQRVDLLQQESSDSTDGRLQKANSYRRNLDLTGTPALYTIFKILPTDYSYAISLFQFLQVISLVTGVALVGWHLEQAWHYWALGLIMSGFCTPFLVDINVANLNSFQFFSLSVLVTILDNNNPKRVQINQKEAIILITTLCSLSLLKPNFTLAYAALGIVIKSRCKNLSNRNILISTLITVTLILGASSLFFGGFDLWTTWYQSLTSSTQRLTYPISEGNASATLILSNTYDIEVNFSSLIMFAFLGLSLVATVIKRQKSNKIRTNSLLKELKNSYLLSGIAIVLTLAVSPLVWTHYYTVLLLPAVWLVSKEKTSKIAANLGILAIIIIGGFFNRVVGYVAELTPEIEAYILISSWILVWFGLLAFINDMSIPSSPAHVSHMASRRKKYRNMPEPKSN
jgi:hypothetical protein